MNIRYFVVVLFSLFLATTAPLSYPKGGILYAPDAFVKEASEKIFAIAKQYSSADSMREYLKTGSIVSEYLDITVMSKLALGKYWNKATMAQRQKFSLEFQHLLISAYVDKLGWVMDDSGIQYISFSTTDNKTAEVLTVAGNKNNVPFHIDYQLLKNIDSEWRIYDVLIEKISLIATYRASYAKIINEHGFDSLIIYLKRKNGTL